MARTESCIARDERALHAVFERHPSVHRKELGNDGIEADHRLHRTAIQVEASTIDDRRVYDD